MSRIAVAVDRETLYEVMRSAGTGMPLSDKRALIDMTRRGSCEANYLLVIGQHYLSSSDCCWSTEKVTSVDQMNCTIHKAFGPWTVAHFHRSIHILGTPFQKSDVGFRIAIP
jgi:hypothetical protein